MTVFTEARRAVKKYYSQIPLQRTSRDRRNMLVVTKIRYNGIALTLILWRGGRTGSEQVLVTTNFSL